MRRDMDLVRDILRACAASPDGKVEAGTLTDGAKRTDQVVAYHIDIMQQAGLIQASIQRAYGGVIVHAEAGPLTWAGNELLDAVDSDAVWRQVKRTLGSTIRTASLDVIKTLASRIALAAIGM